MTLQSLRPSRKAHPDQGRRYGPRFRTKLQSADYCGGLDLMKDQKGNNDLLNLTKPELVRSICESFADAGATARHQYVQRQPISQAIMAPRSWSADQPRAAEIARESPTAIREGRQAALGRRALGPTNKTLSLSPDVNDPAFARSISTRSSGLSRADRRARRRRRRFHPDRDRVRHAECQGGDHGALERSRRSAASCRG
jgi:hypothetical protein